jgi:hypothetical protein
MRFSNIFLGIKALLYPQRKELGCVEFNGFGIFDYCPKKKQHQESIVPAKVSLLIYPILLHMLGNAWVYIYNQLSNLHQVYLHTRYISCSKRQNKFPLFLCQNAWLRDSREQAPSRFVSFLSRFL